MFFTKVKVLHASVQRSIEITHATTFLDRFKSMIFDAVNRRALSAYHDLHLFRHCYGPPEIVPVVGCGMQAFQQLCGFNTLMYYSATLFKEIGFNQPTAVGLIVSGTNFIFTLVALKWIDKIGRRNIMIWSVPGMVFGLTLASISFYCSCSLKQPLFVCFFTDLVNSSSVLTKKTNGTLIDGTHYSTVWSAIVLLSMIVFVASYATGLGNVPWQQGELFGLEGGSISCLHQTIDDRS